MEVASPGRSRGAPWPELTAEGGGGEEEGGHHGHGRVLLELRGHTDETLTRHDGAVGSNRGEDKEEGAVTSEACEGGVQGQGRGGGARARRQRGQGRGGRTSFL